MNLPPEIEEGGVEYKLQLSPLFSLPQKRAESLATQMRWRVRESFSGYATYFIGVNDDGFPRGLVSEKLECSLTTLSAVAELAGAEIVSVLRRPAHVSDNYYAEVLVVLTDYPVVMSDTSAGFGSFESYHDLGYFSSVVDLFSEAHVHDSASYDQLGSQHETSVTSPTLPERDTVVTPQNTEDRGGEIANDDTHVSCKNGCPCDQSSSNSNIHCRGNTVNRLYSSIEVLKCVYQCTPAAPTTSTTPSAATDTESSELQHRPATQTQEIADVSSPSAPSPLPPMVSDPSGDPLFEGSPIRTLRHASPKLEPTSQRDIPDIHSGTTQLAEPGTQDGPHSSATVESHSALQLLGKLSANAPGKYQYGSSHWSAKGKNVSEIWQGMCVLRQRLLEDGKNRELTLEELQILRQVKTFEKQRKYERKLLQRQRGEYNTQNQADIMTNSLDHSVGDMGRACARKIGRHRRRNANAAKRKAQAVYESVNSK